MKKLAVFGLGSIVAFGLLQLVRPGIPTKPAAAELQVPPQVRHILQKDCYSCHSDERRLAWFDQVVPGYWLVRHDVLKAREHLDFSTLGSKPAPMQRATLFEAVNMIQLGAMPLPSFTRLHPDAKVTAEDLSVLKAYLAPWGSTPPKATPTVLAGGAGSTMGVSQGNPPAVSLAAVKPEFNGFPFDPSFEEWKPISTTDRGDNNTFRFILGNDIAIEAVKSGNITPWPDGARLAKIAWQQELGADGLIHPGKFVQVELMQKNASAFKTTEGWGWGRWRGLDLKPYGQDARFVNECTTCHLPVKGNDYVYTLPITVAKVDRTEIVNNVAAALPSNLPYQPLGWSAITMYVDPQTHTTATLYGNEFAISEQRLRNSSSKTAEGLAYGNGSVLALVTWIQRDDPHWFGGRIPNQVRAIEFVQVSSTGAKTYSRYDGTGQLQKLAGISSETERINFIFKLSPASLP